jgi:uncharacterized membrane protein
MSTNKNTPFKIATSYFISGILALLPLALAILIIGFFYGIIKSGLSMITDSQDPAILAWFAVTLLIFVVLIGKEVQTNKHFSWITFGELWLSKFPVLGKVIGIINEFVDMVRGEGKFESLGVARVPFGGSKIYALITNESIEIGEDKKESKTFTVFIVQGTFPPTGLVCFYKEDEVEIIEDMTPADVFQMQITLGVKN